MSDSAEPSYYEIALTNRQVVTAFVILLASVVTAFLSGVWVGRGVGAEPQDATQVAQGGAEVAAARDPEEVPEAGNEFKFFGADPEKGVDPEAGKDADAGERPAHRGVAGLLGARRGRRDTDSPVEDPGNAEARASKDAPVRAPEPEEPTPQDDKLVIQVFSSADEGQARDVLNRVLAGGFSAFLSPDQVDGQTMYRVRVGPFHTRSRAEEVAARLKQRFKLDTWITR